MFFWWTSEIHRIWDHNRNPRDLHQYRDGDDFFILCLTKLPAPHYKCLDENVINGCIITETFILMFKFCCFLKQILVELFISQRGYYFIYCKQILHLHTELQP